MSYVQPCGTIELMRDVDLNNDYQHTYYFTSEAERDAFFLGKRAFVFTTQQYTRVSGNKCRIAGFADELKRCNYMRFCNNRDSTYPYESSVMYYAFITNVEYINENVTEITYEIDEIQTWFLKTTLVDCFIERQHSLTDNVGDNLVPEPFECGSYVNNKLNSADWTFGNNLCYLLGVTLYRWNSTDANLVQLYTQKSTTGAYCGIRWIAFPMTANGETKMQEYINAVTNLGSFADLGSVEHLYIVPTASLFSSANPFNEDGRGIMLSSDVRQHAWYIDRPASFVNEYDTTETYTPLNKKLLTHPYVYFSIETLNAQNDYKFEQVTNIIDSVQSRCWMQLYTVVSDKPYLCVYIVGYDGETYDYFNSVVIDTFPSIPIYSDGMLGAVLREGLNSYLDFIKQSTGFVIGDTPIRYTMRAGSGQSRVNMGYTDVPFMSRKSAHLPSMDLITDIETKQGAPTSMMPFCVNPTSVGGSGTTTLPKMKVHAKSKQIRYQFAKKFDHYLSMYGYAVNDVGVPNVHARKRWTYIKTKDFVCVGAVPNEAKKAIGDAFDRGITFWDKNYQIGVYRDAYGNMTNELLVV